MINELSERFDYIVCDSPAGIEHGALMALYYADEAVVVTNPEVSSVRDSDRILGILQSKSRRAEMGQDPVKEHLLLSRYNPDRVEKGEMLSVADVEEILAIPLLGVIPESQVVLNASNQGVPVILEEDSDAGQAYDDAVARLLGEEREHRFMTSQKKGFFDQPDYLPELQKELLEVIRKYVQISDDQVQVEVDRNDSCSVLELNVTLPEH